VEENVMDEYQEKGNQSADDNEINQQYMKRLVANQVTIRQGGANSIEANEVVLRQAAVLRSKTEQVDASASALGFVQTQAARLDNSTVGMVNSGGIVNLDQSMSNVLVSSGEVTMDQSAAVVLVSRRVNVKNSQTVFLFAQHVEGNVTTMFKSQDAIIFGIAAGLVGGVFTLLSRMFRHK
jgi:hypothetical protein